MHLRTTLLFCLVLLSFQSYAQTFKITGRIADFKDTSAMIGVTIALKDGDDSSINTGLGAVTDVDGKYEIDEVKPGRYILHLAYLGYKTQNKAITVTDKDFNAGVIAMRSSANELAGVTVAGKQIRAEQNGDTTSFHADAYKVNPDATTEDLITKMPGVTSDNTGVKVHGEAVQQVYVDGKPFFGTDPTLSVRNLPAEVVDQVQIYDQLSDQALFTGFDDGSSQKTMNIVTRKDKRRGEFGKIFGGYGTDGKFNGGGAYNSFEGNRRVSIIESSNNINSQNFSSQDILGLGSGRGGGHGFGGGGGGGSNFLTNAQQPGITTVHSAGINYSDQWGPKLKVSMSYFFNYTDNITQTSAIRNYSFPTSNDALDSLQTSLYNEKDSTASKNFNHRANMRFEYTIDSSNSIIFTPNLSLQNNYSVATQTNSLYNFHNLLSDTSANSNTINNSGYSFSGNLVFRHKLHKKGRTISVNFSPSLNEKTGDGTYNTLSAAVDSQAVLVRQRYNSYTNSNGISSNLSYTEPLGKQSQLMFNYNPAVTNSRVTTTTDTLDGITDIPSFDTALSNHYTSTYTTQKGGLSYRMGNKQMHFMIGVNLQYAELDGNQTFPTTANITKYYTNLLPIALFSYKFKDGRNIHIFYRTTISPPGISQLQNVVNVSNPLILTEGNATLRQDYEQNMIVRYGLTKKQKGHNFFIFAAANYINNYITNATYTTLQPDSLIDNNIKLARNAQLLAPVNLDYYSNYRLNLTYGLPLEIIKSNLNLTGGLNYVHTPGEVNQVVEYSNNTVPTGGVVISSNVSPDLDFTLAYTGTYNFVKNSLQGALNNNYYNHTASFKVNWIIKKRLVLNTNISNAYYSSLSSSAGNVNYYLWTSYVAYKFLKNKALEARFTAFDMLNQNKSVTRTVAANYVENDFTNVLQQYFIFQLTYTLRNYKGALPTEDNSGHYHGDFHGGPPPGGGGWHDHGGM